MHFLARSYFLTAYYISWLFFGMGGMALTSFCVLLLPLPGRQRTSRWVRAVIRSLLRLWLFWFNVSHVLRIRWRGMEKIATNQPAIYVANHPTLIDAVLLLPRLPDTICLFKAALLRNPIISAAAIMAGYVAGEFGVELIREAADKVTSGCSLLIFPEGTRTSPGNNLNILKPGFALIAQRAQVPIHIITVRASPGLVPRGRPWWHPPALPAWIEFSHEGEIPADTTLAPAEITALVEQRLSTQLTHLAEAGSS